MRIVIDGAGEVGSHLAKMLRTESNEVVVIDQDYDRLNRLLSYTDVEVVEGNPSSLKVLRQAEVGKADLFIAVYPFATHEVNIVCALLAKKLGAAKVIVRVSDEDFLTPENTLMFKEMGIELMFYPEKTAADEIVSSLKHAATSELMEFARGRLQISTFKLDEDSPLVDNKLSEFILKVSPDESQKFRIIAISRGEETIIPKLETKFLLGDQIFTISRRDGAEVLVKYFGKEDLEIKRVMILGGTSISVMVARNLSRQIESVKIIEKDKERCIELSAILPDNVLIVNGDGRNSDFLYDEAIKDYDAFIALTGKDEENVLACVVAKKFGVPRTIAEVENVEYVKLAEEMGVDKVINKKLISAARIFKFTLSGKARFVRYMSGTDAEVIEYTVAPGSAVTKCPISELKFPKNAIVGGIIRGNESMIAVGDTRIEAYDRVAIFAMPEAVKEVDRLFK